MADELIGKNVGGYVIESVIGHGGMATVYLARDKSMDRPVALKVLPRQYLNDDTYLQRFNREVKIVSQLEHRNIVPVYAYGEYESQPYIVMRYMASGSVDDLLQTGPLSAEKILSIVSQIAPALDYAHSKEVLHRDLKPSNVLLDDGGGAFITDFGIARIAGEHGVNITTQGVVGTPSYMSPEQAQGKSLDGRSDLYGLGVMLFEMATGRRPFESDTPYSIAVMQVTQQPPMPRQFNPDLSTAIESVILKSLKKDPYDRYQTAHALHEALQLAIERPTSVFDTEPNLKKPVLDAKPYPTPAPSPVQPPARYTPPASGSSQAVPSYPNRPRRKRGANPLLGMFIGGSIGCFLLVVLVTAFVIGVLLLTRETTAPAPTDDVEAVPGVTVGQATAAATLTQTLDPTSETARETLIARSVASDATQTAVIQATQAAPTRPPGLDPIGVRGRPSLPEPLQGVSGQILYADERVLFGVTSFEIVRLDLETWEELQLTQDNAENTYPLASPDGRWVVFQSNRDGDFEIYTMNTVGGQLNQLTDNDYLDRLPSWSPDGEWIIYSADTRGDGMLDLYRVRASGGEPELVYSDTMRSSHPRYSPDGRYVVFTHGSDPNDSRTWEIALLELETNELRLLTNNDQRDASPVFSPDGSRIMYITSNDQRGAIASMNIDGSGQQIIYDSSGDDWTASYSPDGQYIVFTSDERDIDQIYLATADGSVVQQISAIGGVYPSWIPSS